MFAPSIFRGILARCWCHPLIECACGAEERILRHYAYSSEPMPAMTSEQRQWCIKQAVDSAEGAMSEQECEVLTDKELATVTLDAWRDYARSQGMY